ncbi:hypothetical protein HN709_04510, partial [Candidatus Peregrinibacteria bacterium]|nr:hypothetical protein [Candidatus Peregrinibacteria bacterium]
MIETDRNWAVMCYIPVLNVVTCPLAAVRRTGSKFCRFHVRQGLVLFALWIFTILIAFISPILSLMMWGVTLLLHGSGAYIAYLQKDTQIPVVGQLAMRIPEYYIYTKLTGLTPEKKDETNDSVDK